MKTLQTGTKVLIEATVEQAYSVNACVKIKTGQFIWLPTSDLTVCETEEPIDLNNFAIDITDPVNAELLPGFKEWFNKQETVGYRRYSKFTFNSSRHYGKRNGLADIFIGVPLVPLTTLPELQKQHPGVFEPQQIEVGDTVVANGDHFMKNGDGKQTLTDKKHYEVISVNEGSFAIIDDRGAHHTFPVDLERAGFFYKIIKKSTPTPSFKAGQEVEAQPCDSKNTEYWKRGKFIAMDGDLFIVKFECPIDISYGACKAIRPIPAQPTVESELRQLYEKAKAIDRYETWKSLATAWHQKHSGRVEVSVPSDREIIKVYDNTLGDSRIAVIKTVRHFMTRKEAENGI